MSDHSIKGIYEMRMSSDVRAIIVSTVSKKDPLKYDYFILSVSSDSNHVSFQKLNSPILLAKDSTHNIHRLDSEGETYKHYADRFTTFFNAPNQTSRKLHLRDSAYSPSPKLVKRNQAKNRT